MMIPAVPRRRLVVDHEPWRARREGRKGRCGQGAHVTLVARTIDQIEARATAIRQAAGAADAVRLDVTDLEAVARMVEAAEPFDIPMPGPTGRHR
jgi:NAD(P)-dependent dehydrogenase (short-subunit alcohol dehydrogenase family)